MNLKGWICSVLLPALVACAAPPSQILVDVDEANPPFMYGRNGRAMGIYPRLINTAFKHMNVAVQVEAKPWKRALAEIEDGTAGVGGIYKNAERLEKYDFSDQLFVEKLIVYFNTDRPVSFSKTGDLKGKRIGVLRGWSYGDDFDVLRKSGTCKVEEVSSDDQNFHKLASLRLDAVIAVSESGSALAPGYKNLRAAAIPLALNPTFLAFAKSSHRPTLLKQFNKTLREMQKSGEFQALVEDELVKR
jgi:polar amino acid transport system substrate-binding protein